MKRPCLVLFALALFASPAAADVTVTMGLSMTGPMAVDGTVITSLKGTKARSDVKMMGQDVSILIDAATRQQWMINHTTRQIAPVNPQQALAGMPITFGDVKVSVSATGQTKEVLGRVCQGFSVEASVPMTLGSETLTMKLSGPAWIATDGPGVAESRAAQKMFADAGLSMSPLSQGPQAKGMASVARTLGDAGLVMEQEIRVAMEGTGQVAQLMGQLGNMTMVLKVTAIATDPIPDAKFAMPEGYARK
jgi:hypothetical protein